VPIQVTFRHAGATETLPALATWDAFDQADEGWYADPVGAYVWVRFSAINSEAQIEYHTGP